jgi:hypothetical protein
VTFAIAVDRRFQVGAPLVEAWRGLAQLERWPEWAPHIDSVTMSPPDKLGPNTTGVIRLRRLGDTTFDMTEWEPPHRWRWQGSLLGHVIGYDHRFEAADETTWLEWTVDIDGSLTSIIRPVFARIYGRNVDRAIPLLQEWYRTSL